MARSARGAGKRTGPGGAGAARGSQRRRRAGDRGAEEGTSGEAASGTAAPLVPSTGGLPALRDAAAGCRACDLWERGTQTVFGEGAESAELVLVGEQPGDREDLSGRPFVGPAGRLLDEALAAARIDRRSAYVTNAVKHFKWEPRGKRRIHQKPNAAELRACRPWLDAELAALRPRALVCLGATAAQALLGRTFKVTLHRGEILRDSPLAPLVMATVHPSSILRAPDDESRRRELEAFVADLAGLARALREPG
jgi:DNA polymerase